MQTLLLHVNAYFIFVQTSDKGSLVYLYFCNFLLLLKPIDVVIWAGSIFPFSKTSRRIHCFSDERIMMTHRHREHMPVVIHNESSSYTHSTGYILCNMKKTRGSRNDGDVITLTALFAHSFVLIWYIKLLDILLTSVVISEGPCHDHY